MLFGSKCDPEQNDKIKKFLDRVFAGGDSIIGVITIIKDNKTDDALIACDE